LTHFISTFFKDVLNIANTGKNGCCIVAQFIEANQGFDRSVRLVGFKNYAGDVLF